MKKDFLIRALIGTIIGLAICITLYAFGIFDNIVLDNKGLMISQFVGSAILGFVSMGGTIVYDVEKWGLTKVTALHYAMTLAVFVLDCLILSWFPLGVLPIVLVIFTIAYFIIWLINYLIYKRNIRDINSDLDELRKREEGESHE